MYSLDETDISLLSYIQKNGRATNVQLSEHLNLSETPSWRRLKFLEQEGYIERYQAILNQKKLGFQIIAFVQIFFSVHTDEAPEEFEKAVQKIPEILSCYNITGEADYMLIVLSEDLTSYEILLRNTIRRLPGVTSVKSILSLKEVKNTSFLPIHGREKTQ